MQLFRTGRSIYCRVRKKMNIKKTMGNYAWKSIEIKGFQEKI